MRYWPHALAALVGLSALGGTAEAHPHVLTDVQEVVVFDKQGQVTGLKSIWRFDDAFSAYAVQGYDDKGKYTRASLQPLAQINVDSLADFKYFTSLKIGDQQIPMAKKATDYWLAYENGVLTLHFTLATSRPVPARGRTFEFDIYDPDYFVAYSFMTDRPPVLLADAPGECSIKVNQPDALDAQTAILLAQIPASQRSVPDSLKMITSKLNNGFRVTCP
ncbi:ABC-type uncharacterized transport system, substrate-binding protein [Faunimonas pinastri]|uniref:ABC-type uncharacterized transport system, substrate-binding protein n=1 Tax=Faunimonas pinastri TaxID=1855383 RepID=A0A1H9AHC3_9HYPH|nr:DUF1007 family protein [Faunimonas pinastri]SEP75881.1 ABC-type uncharacterized transport system, substrate-binding protein [Faunimonas pinastri]